MLFHHDPDFVVMKADCPHCDEQTTFTVNAENEATCNSCAAEVTPPMSYTEAYEKHYCEMRANQERKIS